MKKIIFSIISIITSAICILFILRINYKIAIAYMALHGKDRLLFGITEYLCFYYKYYFIALSFIALLLAIIATTKKENKIINSIAYLVGILSVIIIFIKIWKLMI